MGTKQENRFINTENAPTYTGGYNDKHETVSCMGSAKSKKQS